MIQIQDDRTSAQNLLGPSPARPPESEDYYGSRISAYRDLLGKVSRSGEVSEASVTYLENALQGCERSLDNLIARKRAEGQPIQYEYAQADDMVFCVEEQDVRLTKRDMLNACMGDDVAARRLTEACQHRGVKAFGKAEDNYESFAYNGALDELRRIYGSQTIYNRVVLMHDGAFRRTEIVFDGGLDHLVGELDPVSDFEEWDRRLDEVREAFQDLSRQVLGEEARLVWFSPAKNRALGAQPLIAGDHQIVIESHGASLRTELALDLTAPHLEQELQTAIEDMFENFDAAIRIQP